jgi:Fe-S cluster biogenesis protein NfuA
MESSAPEFQRQLSRIEELINALNVAPDSVLSAKSRELTQALLELHGTGLERVFELIHGSALNGQALIDQLAEDQLISNLLILHGLHPLDLETRVRNALEAVKPRLGLHGGSVKLVGVTPQGGIKLRLEGNCHGCPSSRVTLKSSIEEALYAAAPDVTGLEVEGAVDNFVNAPDGLQPKFTMCPTDSEQKPTTKEIP